jgi:hypothetical protein
VALRASPAGRIVKRRLAICWTCSDAAHHAHRSRATAYVCGALQRFWASVFAPLSLYALACVFGYLLLCAWLDYMDAQLQARVDQARIHARSLYHAAP